MIFRIVVIGNHAQNLFGSYICVGAALMLILHIMINVGMNIGIMPITGIPLPLMSYGGSSVMVNMITLGIVQNVVGREAIKPGGSASGLTRTNPPKGEVGIEWAERDRFASMEVTTTAHPGATPPCDGLPGPWAA